ncbi:hypothetical protein AQUCO_04300087v1 [Aquilegia coerulea]|uniref:Helitron helicase-like domain-containing protein n=1 Tax=Aquilegia coerulea TaxID=218851 RepID=A0A2G5CNL1_AQUCA|nr:hypothetical protein AQUCO_04300087v1 [Aquilegia coerulea]
MHVLRNKRATTANANTPSQSNPDCMPRSRTRGRYRRVQSNPISMRENRIKNRGMRAKRALFQDPIYIESNCLPRKIDVNGYEIALPPYDLGKIFEPLKLEGPSRVCKKCKAIVWFEERNRKYARLNDPRFSICSMDEKIKLPLLQHPPQFLQRLMNFKGGPLSAKFRKNIRRYNSMFALTSMGGKIDKSINNGRGPYVFKLHGQNYHKIGSLLPSDGRSSESQLPGFDPKPKFAQLYIYDTEHEAQNRMGIYNDMVLNTEIVQGLMKMFDENNALVVALIVGDGGEVVDHRDIIVEKRTGGLQRITELHPSYMAMQYPLIFPYGEDGFWTNILYNGLVVARDKGRSNQRENEGRTLIMAGRLFQQFLVDAYTSVEEERLRWVWKNQKLIRSDLYQGLRDVVIRGDTAANVVGKRLVLPPTYTGVPRYMVQRFQDAMVICRWDGSPDLFITVTCNPKWSEITEALSLIPGQKSEDRPDIVSRMFNIKLDLLMDDLCIHNHFGKVWADGADKPNTSAKVNKIIFAELPDKALDPLTYDSVLEFMIHGPCGGDKESFPCMEKGKCSKRYLKQYSNDMIRDPEDFYIYSKTSINEYQLFHIHNLDLVLKYQCHINVEACNRGRAVKYLFKYIHKGKDRATIVIEQNSEGDNNDGGESVKIIDEIKTYLDCRYISASEASWRIFGFSTQFREPAVERLPFHLEDEQVVTYRDSNNTAEVLERASTIKTKFLQWMEINKKYPDDPNAS